MNKEYSKYVELTNRSCDALVLAYSPEESLTKNCGRNFYIPECSKIEESFGFSLRKIFGEINGTNHWTDSVKWGNVANLNKLEKRIVTGTEEIICGDPDYQTIFEGYFSSSNINLENTWIYGRGSFYGFAEGKRETALGKFEEYWNKKEKSRWDEIHKIMREYTKQIFEMEK